MVIPAGAWLCGRGGAGGIGLAVAVADEVCGKAQMSDPNVVSAEATKDVQRHCGHEAVEGGDSFW